MGAAPAATVSQPSASLCQAGEGGAKGGKGTSAPPSAAAPSSTSAATAPVQNGDCTGRYGGLVLGGLGGVLVSAVGEFEDGRDTQPPHAWLRPVAELQRRRLALKVRVADLPVTRR